MLTWMQHHRKYLIVTIWVSVIAFVGAGFVGWGSYGFDFNKGSSIAVVGDKKITFNEFNTRYNQIFSYYNQISGGQLTQEMAKNLGIESFALNSLIEDKLLLQFAMSLGLRTNNKEIIKELENTKEFQDENGVFNKNIYYQILAQNNITPKNYEEIIKNKITISKLENIFKIPSSDIQLQMIASSLFMQDLLDIKKIEVNTKNIKENIEKMKQIWNKNQDKFKTKAMFELQTFFINDKLELTEDELIAFYNENKLNYKDLNGKILSYELAKDQVKNDLNIQKLKTLANKQYIKLNKNETTFNNDINISVDDKNFPLEMIKNTNENDILKPFVYKDGYLIVKVKKINPSRNKTFEEAKNEVFSIYKEEEIKNQLILKAENELKDFNSNINTGFISRDSLKDDKIPDTIMNDPEFSYFVSNVFNKDLNSSYVLFEDKAIVYKIKKQKLFSQNKFDKYKTMLEQNLQNLKANELKQELIKQLEKEYSIKIYYKGN